MCPLPAGTRFPLAAATVRYGRRRVGCAGFDVPRGSASLGTAVGVHPPSPLGDRAAAAIRRGLTTFPTGVGGAGVSPSPPAPHSSPTYDRSSLTVIGAGQMGSGIAQVAAAAAAFDAVRLADVRSGAAAAAVAAIGRRLDRRVASGRMGVDAAAAARKALVPLDTCDVAAIGASSAVVVEAVAEDAGVKANLFGRLDAAAPASTLLASNTSSISITSLAAAAARHPDRVVGLHFFHPVPSMNVVELIPGLATSAETLAAARSIAATMGMTVAMVRDEPGFVANRLLMPYINEAAAALGSGVATRDDIDAVMVQGTGVPMGPLALADFIGLDTCVAILRVLEAGLGGAYKPTPLLVRHVAAGRLGVKSGRGFYEYDEAGKRKA
ncbi:hypothetical protein MMPV_001171 [Pyropia vietnamensis]